MTVEGRRTAVVVATPPRQRRRILSDPRTSCWQSEQHRRPLLHCPVLAYRVCSLCSSQSFCQWLCWSVDPAQSQTQRLINNSQIHAMSLTTSRLTGGSPRFLVTQERLVICISEFRCWYSVSMLFCYTTACQSLTARTEHHTFQFIFVNF